MFQPTCRACGIQYDPDERLDACLVCGEPLARQEPAKVTSEAR
jgi:rRNA maturation endonuclease Nob1